MICSFWLVSALAIIGDMQRARDLMERLVKVASPLGLYAEEFDVDTGRHLGNFPQAFSHLALVEAAGRIVVAERLAELSARWRDITSIVLDMCVNRDTQRPFSRSMIEHAMRQLHFSVRPTQGAKQQALELIETSQAVAHLPSPVRPRGGIVAVVDDGADLVDSGGQRCNGGECLLLHRQVPPGSKG